MKKALWKDFIMEIKTTWNRLLSIFLIVALGCAFYAGIKATNPDMRITADHYFDHSKLMDLRLLSTWGFTKEDIEELSQIEMVEILEPFYSTHVVAVIEEKEMVLEVMSVTEKINLITVSEGRMPETKDEILLDSYYARSSGLKMGDQIHLESGTDESLANRMSESNFTIVGIGSTPLYLSFQRGSTTLGNGSVNGFIVVPPEVFEMGVYSGTYIMVKESIDLMAFSDEYNVHIDKASELLVKKMEEIGTKRYGQIYEDGMKDLTKPKAYVLDRNTNEAYVEYEQNADRMSAIGEVFPAIFFLVAALISLTTMTRMVEEQRTQIGVLKALGYSKAAISRKYILYALLATVGGSVLGVAVGLKLFPTVIITAYKIMYVNLPKIYTPFNLYYGAIATGLSVFSVEIATYFACYKVFKAKPADLMRPVAPKNGKRVLVERIPFLWNHLSFTWKATTRNLLRYKKRFFMTVFGIGGCMALLLVGFGLMDSIMVIYTNQFYDIQKYDAIVTVDSDGKKEEYKELEIIFSNNSHITDVMKARDKMIVMEFSGVSKNVHFVVVEDPDRVDSFISLRTRKKHKTIKLHEDGIILSEHMANQLGIRTGDMIHIKEGDFTIEVIVSDITENYMFHYLYMTPSLYRQLFGKDVEYNQYYVLAPQASDNQIGGDVLDIPIVTGITYTSYYLSLVNNIMKSMNIVIWVITIAAGGLAYIVLYNLNHINMNERRRELATLKVLGFYNYEISSYVYRENVILTVIGMGLGVVLGVILHRYVIQTVEIDMLMFGRTIDGSSYHYSVMLTTLFAVIVNVVIFFKLKKINMVDSLKSVE